MRDIVYYVACSVDGYIAGPRGDSSMFVKNEALTAQYRQDLESFDTVIMCRQTYEMGYGYGLQPGQPTVENKKHFIFSKSLYFERHHPDVSVLPPDVEHVRALKSSEGPGIFLCGGGHFAGWLMEKGLIDVLKVRLNPVILGAGTPVFGHSPEKARMELVSSRAFDGGVQMNEYRICN